VDCLPISPDQSIDSPAGTSWSGLTYGPNSESVRDAVRLVAAISGDLTGSVDCGTVYRLQVGGNIDASVTAVGADIPGTNGHDAIAQVVARRVRNDGSSQTGAILATAGDIGFVDVGTFAAQGEIRGPIAAPTGQITSVACVGPIDIADPVGIRAGLGINTIAAQVSIAAEQFDVDANIQANYNFGSGDLTALWCRNYSGELRAVNLLQAELVESGIRSSGTLLGKLTISGYVGSPIYFADTGPQSEIIVSGNVYADIFSRGGLNMLTVGGNVVGGGFGTRVGCCGRAGTILLGGLEHIESEAGYNTARIEAGEIGSLETVGTCSGYVGPPADPGCLTASQTYTPVDQFVVGGLLRGHIRVNPLGGITVAFGADITDLSAGDGQPSLYIPSLAADRTIRIGGGLGSNGFDVFVGDAGGLRGAIIINAQNSPGFTDWQGQVRIGTSTPSPIQLSPNSHHTQTSSQTGGGVAALPPFRLHGADCSPAINSPVADRTFLNSAFSQLGPGGECAPSPLPPPYLFKKVVLRFDGPVRVNHASANPVTITFEDGTTDLSPFFDITVHRVGQAGWSREIIIKGDGQTLHMPGTYYVRPVLDAQSDGRVLCDQLLTSADVPVGEDFGYVFLLTSDCNRNGIDDTDDIAADPLLDTWAPDGPGSNGKIDCCEPCDPDYDQDGNVDQQDVDYLQNVLGGGPNPTGWNPDFNRDGNADQDDLAALINAVAGGGCP
jgi:hypothetical protein